MEPILISENWTFLIARGNFIITKMQKDREVICIALPKRVNEYGQTERLAEVLESFIANLGFKTIESHKVLEHRSLTREIMVYEKI